MTQVICDICGKSGAIRGLGIDIVPPLLKATYTLDGGDDEDELDFCAECKTALDAAVATVVEARKAKIEKSKDYAA
jgi:hypothetical protein